MVVVNACNAKVLVGTLATNLNELEECRVRRTLVSDRLIRSIGYAHMGLRELLTQHDARMRGVVEALDRGGDSLPLREFGSSSEA